MLLRGHCKASDQLTCLFVILYLTNFYNFLFEPHPKFLLSLEIYLAYIYTR